MTNIGTVITFNAPFLADYFDHSSTGLASSYIQVFQTASALTISSGIPFVNSRLDDIKWVFYGIGAVTLFFTAGFVFGLKDIQISK